MTELEWMMRRIKYALTVAMWATWPMINYFAWRNTHEWEWVLAVAVSVAILYALVTELINDDGG